MKKPYKTQTFFPFAATFFKVKTTDVSFFVNYHCPLHSVMHLLPTPVSWTGTHSKMGVFMVQIIILMTFLPRGKRDRGREGEISVFLLPALSTLGSTIQSELNEVIRSVWGSFPRAEPFGIFCSFLNAEMLSTIAQFLQTMLCNAHLICVYDTASHDYSN